MPLPSPVICAATACFAALLARAVPAAEPSAHALLAAAQADEALVDVARACPGAIIELRYASARNVTGQAIYPAGAHALLRRDVAGRLSRAQQILETAGCGLKVWDAYRPPWVQRVLWNAVRDPAYVVEPKDMGSLHGWGAAVDVTLVDARGREMKMPTDFDAFSGDARYEYSGTDPEIMANLRTLQKAMAEAGFRHIRDEWWHYSIAPPPRKRPLETSLFIPDAMSPEPRRAAATPVPKPTASAAARQKKPASRPLFPEPAQPRS